MKRLITFICLIIVIALGAFLIMKGFDNKGVIDYRVLANEISK